MTESPPTIPPAPFRPADWLTWWFWIAVCAASPVCLAVSEMAFNKQISRTDPYASLISAAVLAVLVGASIAPLLMYWAVLRRIAPRLHIGFWICGLLLVGIGWFLFAAYGPRGGSLFDYFSRAEQHFNLAVLRTRRSGLSLAQFFNLPWERLLLAATVVGVATSLIPAWMVSRAAHRRLYTFIVAIIAGTVAAAIVAQTYNVLGYSRSLTHVDSLNGQPWIYRINELALRAGAGAAWGAVSGLVFVLMSRSSIAETGFAGRQRAIQGTRGLIALVLAVVLVPAAFPFAAYLAGPQGVRAGAPALRKAVALAPSEDRSEGETVLTYAHDVAVPASAQSAGVVFAPDGQTAIVRSAANAVTRVELATGRAVGQIGEPLEALERYSGLFSPDNRYFLLRSNGAEVAIPKTHYKRHQSRVRVFALPDYRLIGEFQAGPEECFDSYASDAMLFEPDGHSVWLVCAQHYAPKSEDVVAIKLDVPSMQQRELRRFDDSASSGQTQGLHRADNAVWAWQFGSGDARLRIRDLTNDRNVLVLPDIRTPELIGSLTAQTGRTEIGGLHVTLVACGEWPGVANPPPATPGASNSFCRSLRFDIRTGALLGTSDSSDPRFGGTPNAALDAGHGLRIEALWQNDSKTGEIIVRDATTGRQRQRIVSVSQRPLRLSPDGRWLMTYALDRQSLRLYRVTP